MSFGGGNGTSDILGILNNPMTVTGGAAGSQTAGGSSGTEKQPSLPHIVAHNQQALQAILSRPMIPNASQGNYGFDAMIRPPQAVTPTKFSSPAPAAFHDSAFANLETRSLSGKASPTGWEHAAIS